MQCQRMDKQYVACSKVEATPARAARHCGQQTQLIGPRHDRQTPQSPRAVAQGNPGYPNVMLPFEIGLVLMRRRCEFRGSGKYHPTDVALSIADGAAQHCG